MQMKITVTALLLTLVVVFAPIPGVSAGEGDSGPIISSSDIVVSDVNIPIGIASTGDVLRQFTPTGPTGNGRGVAFDGMNLYYTIVGNTNIFRTDMFGNLTATIPTPFIPGAGQPRGGPLAWDGTNLWTINYGTNGDMVQLNTSGGLVSTCNIFTANPGHPALTPSSRIDFEDGLDWTGIPGSELVLSGEAFAGNSVIFLNTSCGIQSWFTPLVKSGWGTSGVAFDGVDLWHAYPISSQAFQTNVTGGETGLNFSTAPLALEDLAYDTVTFAPKCALWANNAAGTNQLTAYEVPCGTPPGIEVPVDIKPQSCPNPLNTNDMGMLPAAIPGNSTLDVSTIDPSTVMLEGVSPVRWSMEDVATPFEPFTGKVDKLDCTTSGMDGYMDLTLKFDAQDVVAALGAVSDGDVITLELTGNLFDGTPIMGEDVVWIKMKK